MLKMALFDCGITMKNVAALTEDGAFALFVRPHHGGFDSSGVPTLGNLPSKAKKLLMPRGWARGGAGRRWNWLVHYESLPWLRCKSGAKEHSSHLSHNNKRNTDIEQKNWKPCWVRFPGSEKLGASRNGRMERNFPVIPIFRNFRPTSRGTPKISEWNSGNVCSIRSQTPNFRNVWSNGKRPGTSRQDSKQIWENCGWVCRI